MKYLLPSLGLLGSFLYCSSALGQVTLPVSAAFPPGSGANPGFVVKTVQAAPEAVIDNTYLRAVRQLNGTLTDAGGAPVPDISEPGPQPGGVTYADTVEFAEEEFNGSGQFFEDRLFPGLALGGSKDLFATEVVTFVELPAGQIRMGVTAGFARTDEVNDDGWRLFCGTNPRSFFNPLVAEFGRNSPPFPNGTELAAGNRNEFTINVPQAGVYPFRLVYWQQTARAMLEWYIVKDPEGPSEERVLLNGGNGVPVAYRGITNAPTAVGPYVAEVSPLPDSAGVPANQPVEILLTDGTTTIVDASIKLFLNNTQVTPQENQRVGSKILLAYNPNAARPNPQNIMRLEFLDSAGATTTQQWQFTSTVSGSLSAPVAGQWDFDLGDLRGTAGSPLAYLDGPGGVTAQGTSFGSTADFGLPEINGQAAVVMKVPGELDRNIGYVMNHGISPNGGGTLVNQYTLIMDVFVDPAGPGAASLWQTSSPTNTDDGDLFWQGNNFGQGGGGYNGTGQFTAGAWHRVVAAYDMAATPPVVTKYVDGVKQDDWTANQGLDNPRRALQPTAILFGDGDQDERRVMYVNSVQIRAGKLTDAEMVILGGPDAAGIPRQIPTANVAGQWDFNSGNLAASIGKPLAYLDGVGGLTETGTTYGTPADFSIDELPGGTVDAPSKVMRAPGELDRNIGYVMTHGISPNGGGTLVNQYTLIMDVLVDPAGPGAASLWQTSSPTNTDDGDLFWQGSNFGQGGGGYNGTGQFTAGAWHRVAIAYDMAATPPVAVKYVDGVKQDDWTANQGLDNPRRALQPTAILFGDGDQDERRVMYVNSVQIRPVRLSDAQLALLGGPHTSGIPVELPGSDVAGQWDFDRGTLAATVGAPLQYLDGVGGLTETGTQYGVTTDVGVDDIGGQPAQVMVVPGDLDRNIGYIMTHRIAPNGGGTLVNQYTLIMDVQIATGGPGAASMLQVSSPTNTDDGDLFWQGSNFGQGGGGYNGTGEFTAGAWHRVAASYNMAANPPVVVKYVNGVFQDNWTANQGLDNPRRALQPTAVLFGDGDQDERRQWWVNSIQIRAGALNGEQLASLGGPQAGGIPLVLPDLSAPELSFGRGQSSFVVTWPKETTGWALQSSANLSAWANVAGVTNNSAVIATSPATPQVYFRLKKTP
jgi:hypothetical protein